MTAAAIGAYGCRDCENSTVGNCGGHGNGWRRDCPMCLDGVCPHRPQPTTFVGLPPSPWECPRCGKINAPSTASCDCPRDFVRLRESTA